jgi:hypothetical protein
MFRLSGSLPFTFSRDVDPMKPEEIVSVMAAVLATAQQAPVRLDQTETAYDRIASQAWDLYQAVQFTATEAVIRGTNRYARP